MIERKRRKEPMIERSAAKRKAVSCVSALLWGGVLFGLCALPVLGAVGDVSGTYRTDLHTVLNGAEIETIDVGGHAYIHAEAMRDYGFAVYWNGEARALYVSERKEGGAAPLRLNRTDDTPAGAPLGVYYETDIQTYVDGCPIDARNTGGDTYLSVEGLASIGYDVQWDEESRTYFVTGLLHRMSYSRRLALGERGEGGTEGATEEEIAAADPSFAIVAENGRTTGYGAADLFEVTFSCDARGYTFRTVFYQNGRFPSSEKLRGELSPLCSVEYEEEIADPADFYDRLAETVFVSINGYAVGHPAGQGEPDGTDGTGEQTLTYPPNAKITLERTGGNGHSDYIFRISGLPLVEEEKLSSVVFSYGDCSAMEPFAMTPAE